MDKNRLRYKEYVVDIRPWQARDGKGWIPEVSVEHHFGSGVTVTPLYSKKVLLSEDDAIKYSISMAKQWIDEKG